MLKDRPEQDDRHDSTIYQRPFLLIPVGYPADACTVPNLRKKPLDEVRVVR